MTEWPPDQVLKLSCSAPNKPLFNSCYCPVLHLLFCRPGHAICEPIGEIGAGNPLNLPFAASGLGSRSAWKTNLTGKQVKPCVPTRPQRLALKSREGCRCHPDCPHGYGAVNAAEPRASCDIGRSGSRCRGLVGGAGGIRTLDTLLAYTHFPGERLRPLGHRSACLSAECALDLPPADSNCVDAPCLAAATSPCPDARLPLVRARLREGAQGVSGTWPTSP